MPENDTGTELSEMRAQVETEQGDIAEGMSEMQDYVMGEAQEQEVNPEDAKYRVIMADWGSSDNRELFIDYFSDYTYAQATFDALCDDTDFIKAHDKKSVAVMLQKSYRGLSQVFWETIRKSTVYDNG